MKAPNTTLAAIAAVLFTGLAGLQAAPRLASAKRLAISAHVRLMARPEVHANCD